MLKMLLTNANPPTPSSAAISDIQCLKKINFYRVCQLSAILPPNSFVYLYLTDIPRQREEYEVIYGMRQNTEWHITSILRAGVEYLFYYMTKSRYLFVT